MLYFTNMLQGLMYAEQFERKYGDRKVQIVAVLTDK